MFLPNFFMQYNFDTNFLEPEGGVASIVAQHVTAAI